MPESGHAGLVLLPVKVGMVSIDNSKSGLFHDLKNPCCRFSELLQRGRVERRGARRRDERRRALRRPGGHYRRPQNVCSERRFRGILQGSGERLEDVESDRAKLENFEGLNIGLGLKTKKKNNNKKTIAILLIDLLLSLIRAHFDQIKEIKWGDVGGWTGQGGSLLGTKR